MKLKITFLLLILNLILNAQIGNASPNVLEPWTNGKFTNIATSNSGGGICISGVSNAGNLIDNNFGNFATVNLPIGIGCSRTIVVKDNDTADTYPAGTYAGYKISSAGLIGASLLATVNVSTYNNGVFAETLYSTTSLAGINSALLNADGTANVGGLTTKSFDEVRITFTSLASLLFTNNVYYAQIEKFQAGPTPVCNTSTPLIQPNYGVLIEPTRTGLSGVSVGTVSNASNVVNNNTSDFATLSLNASILGTASLSVRGLWRYFFFRNICWF